MSAKPLRVFVVDASVHYRRLLSELVEDRGNSQIVATSSKAHLALAKLQSTQTDLILLDLHTPEADGVKTLREIRRLCSDVNVVVMANQDCATAKAREEALELGAIGYIEKPGVSDTGQALLQFKQKLDALLQLARIRQNLAGASTTGSDETPSATSSKPLMAKLQASGSAPCSDAALVPTARAQSRSAVKVDIVAIGISTGGPEALMRLIPELPADLEVPVLIVQHMPPLFTASLASDLAKKSRIMVKEAVDGDAVRPGLVLLAPGGRHMVVRPLRSPITGEVSHVIGLNDGPLENSCRPAVDVLFRSIAAHFAGRVLAVVMTGMGTDGCEGVRAMRAAGCYCVTQSAETCVVYGMPMAVDEAGLSDETVALPVMAAKITTLVRKRETR